MNGFLVYKIFNPEEKSNYMAGNRMQKLKIKDLSNS